MDHDGACGRRSELLRKRRRKACKTFVLPGMGNTRSSSMEKQKAGCHLPFLYMHDEVSVLVLSLSLLMETSPKDTALSSPFLQYN